jgi:hypothetical protein
MSPSMSTLGQYVFVRSSPFQRTRQSDRTAASVARSSSPCAISVRDRRALVRTHALRCSSPGNALSASEPFPRREDRESRKEAVALFGKDEFQYQKDDPQRDEILEAVLVTGNCFVPNSFFFIFSIWRNTATRSLRALEARTYTPLAAEAISLQRLLVETRHLVLPFSYMLHHMLRLPFGSLSMTNSARIHAVFMLSLIFHLNGFVFHSMIGQSARARRRRRLTADLSQVRTSGVPWYRIYALNWFVFFWNVAPSSLVLKQNCEA